MRPLLGFVLLALAVPWANAQDLHVDAAGPGITAPGPSVPAKKDHAAERTYVLGPDDQITVRALQVEEIPVEPLRISPDGTLRLPLAGRITAAGQTVEQLEQQIADKLRPFVLDPEVTVSITEFRSEPVSVLGAVRTPGVYQLQGHKTLAEMLSMAGGLDPAAGSIVTITRPVARGPIPIKGAGPDPTGEFNVAEISLTSILKAKDPADNIAIQSRDVITVPRAEMVYVVGQVQKAGGFVLNDAKTMTLLQALSMAGGLGTAASPQHSMILRPAGDKAERAEVPVNVTKILEGKSPDVPLLAGDILFVPNSLPKRAALRAVEAAIETGSGIAIWHR